MKRGDIVTVASKGDHGKPRPALVIQSDLFDRHQSATILPITSELRSTPLFRVPLEAGYGTGLHHPSQVMVDKAQTVPRARIGRTVGCLDDDAMIAVNRALALFLGFA